MDTKHKNKIIEEEEEEIVSVGLKATNYSNLIDRFFKKLYINKDKYNEQFIFIHSNGIAICGLGKNNIIVEKNLLKEIKDLKKLEAVKGKKKTGARVLNENECILELLLYSNSSSSSDSITLENKNELNILEERLDNMKNIKQDVINNSYKFLPKINKAKLMEINYNVINDVEILFNSPEKFGYLCMVFLDNSTINYLSNKYK